MTPQTPMLKQYFAAKAEHPEVILAMRVGDFYEFYGEDAEIAARTLEITLTGREDGSNGRISMAGVPFHSVEKYLARLVQSGLKVALCDQIEDPKSAKGLVRRAVTRVFTPGTLMEDSMLAAGQNNFLAALFLQRDRAGLATLDPSTGEFLATEMLGESLGDRVLQELARIRPAELILNADAHEIGAAAAQGLGIAITETDAPDAARAIKRLLQQLGTSSLAGYGCEDKPAAVIAAAMALAYAEKNRLDLVHVDQIATYSTEGFVAIDPSTRRSLELTQNLSDGSRSYTLLSILDRTVTPMGARLIRRWIEQPLVDREAIQRRLNAVSRFSEATLARGDLRDALRTMADLERLVSRCATGYATPRDLAGLARSLALVPTVGGHLESVAFGLIQESMSQLGDHRELALMLQRAIVDEPPLTLREGSVIRDDFDPELDKLRHAGRDGKSYIAQLEAKERERSGIPTLKVGYNSVFGYYLEASKQYSERVPADYIRKQTTANTERYITAELKEHESQVLGASEKAIVLESEIFHKLRARVVAATGSILQTARAIAQIDVLATLAEVALARNYRKPEVTDDNVLEITSGRHPVVEEYGTAFVPNDTDLQEDGTRLIVLTGPNMSGKSTYLRQNALIVLLAQLGSFVPAETAKIGICDAVFARIGAKDELALGQSTFMVEMLESAYILNHSTPRSLVVLDEVGRGTSTFDGLAIAWAMVERLAEIGAKTLFATHYHQLNALAETIPGIANFRVSVQEIGDSIVWTHRVLAGGTDRSYGIHVARSAGMPPHVLKRAADILAELESKESNPRTASIGRQKLQLTLFEAEDPEVVRDLRNLDVNALTPLQALALLDQWKSKVGGPD